MSRRSAATGAHVSTAAASFLPPCSAREDGGRGADAPNFSATEDGGWGQICRMETGGENRRKEQRRCIKRKRKVRLRNENLKSDLN